jgi:hypothetical protein
VIVEHLNKEEEPEVNSTTEETSSVDFEADQPKYAVMKFLQKKWESMILTPKQKFKVYWDFLIIILSIINSIQIPIEFAFPEVFDEATTVQISDRIIDVLFIFDIFINFRTAYVDSRTDELILNPNKIARNYFKGRFWIDLVASLPFNDIVKAFGTASEQS